MSKENTAREALIVDDSFLIRRLHKENLTKLNFNVTETNNGKEAISVLAEKGPEHFRLIVTDLIMPEMNGVELILELKKKYPENLPPLLVCSSKSDIELIKKVAKLGISGYIIKPVDPILFAKKIEEIA
jgi:CheY-like chemotaxis protein